MYIYLLKYGYKVWSPLFYPSNVLSNSEVSFIVISLGNSVPGNLSSTDLPKMLI